MAAGNHLHASTNKVLCIYVSHKIEKGVGGHRHRVNKQGKAVNLMSHKYMYTTHAATILSIEAIFHWALHLRVLLRVQLHVTVCLLWQ